MLELGDGPPLLLVHGGGDAAFEWIPILVPLAETHHVLAIDRPGHGLADAFSYRKLDLADHAISFIGEVLDALEIEGATSSRTRSGLLGGQVRARRPATRVQLVIAGAPPGVTRDAPLPMRVMGVPLVGRRIGRLMMGSPSRDNSRKFWTEMLVADPRDSRSNSWTRTSLTCVATRRTSSNSSRY